jgi:hypothetical protein
VDSRLAVLQQEVGAVANTAANLPVLNSPMQSIAAYAQSAVGQFQSKLDLWLMNLNPKATQGDLQNYLYPLLDQSGFLPVPLNPADRVLTKDPTTNDIRITLNVVYQVAAPSDPSGHSFTLGLGLPGVPLSLSGLLQVQAGFGYNQLSFGIHGNGQPFIDASGQLQAKVQANILPGAHIGGTLGFLTVTAQNNNTNLNATVAVPVTPSGFGAPQLGGGAHIGLHLDASLNVSNVQTDPEHPDIAYQYPGVVR